MGMHPESAPRPSGSTTDRKSSIVCGLSQSPYINSLRQIRTCILRGVVVPEWLQDGAVYGEEGPALELDSLMVRVAALRAQSLTLFLQKNSTLPSLAQHSKDIATGAQELDIALASWSGALPADWKFSTQPSPAGPDSTDMDHLYDGSVHIYATHGHAALWNRYRAVRLIVNSIRLRSLSTLCQCPSQRSFGVAQPDECQKIMDSLAKDLCGSVPFFFTSRHANQDGAGLRFIRIGNTVIRTEREILPQMATLLVWPLAVAVNTEGVPNPQRQWLKHRLRSGADALGDAILESVVEGEFKF